MLVFKSFTLANLLLAFHFLTMQRTASFETKSHGVVKLFGNFCKTHVNLEARVMFRAHKENGL